jgi:hypothetical protein
MSGLVSDDDLTRARGDAAFRLSLMKQSLERLLAALNRLRNDAQGGPDTARQIREGVDLAVKLAGRLQQIERTGGPRAA